MEILPGIPDVPRATDRIGFLYLEFCALVRYENEIRAMRRVGTVSVPVAQVNTLWLGPSVTITQQAMTLIMRYGVTVMWVGEDGLAFYAHGSPLTHGAKLLYRQALIHTSPHRRMACAREMYAMRFGDVPDTADSIAKLRGAEGARVKRAYRECANEFGVEWDGRSFTPGDMGKSNTVNQALTVAHHCMYAIIGGIVHSLGLHPGMGVVHNGTQDSFVYDIADLYKVEICVPIAFRVARDFGTLNRSSLASAVRRTMREATVTSKTVPRAVDAIHHLLGADTHEPVAGYDRLWDGGEGG